ncbi:peptide-methionine (S)-S-oxide reductase MsrA [Sphingobium sp.]|uniref:peptide-methionine (S)-S-oxide reductase MsrA n=1 Tax=Sphingobium sp. TaxID=1912891 RepID=UPI0039C9EFC4
MPLPEPFRLIGGGLAAALLLTLTPGCGAAAETTVNAPAPRLDPASTTRLDTAIFAGGCFWGVEGVFSHVKGVTKVVSGYAGPNDPPVDYERVSSGTTGFAEAVRVTYDPSVVSYGTLMRVFFSVITDPTTLNYQGPDHGTQYRSALFPMTPMQDKTARAYLAQLGDARLWNKPIVTKVERYRGFQQAEDYHQDFLARHPDHGYIRQWDMPKLVAFKATFPTLWQAQATR